VAYYKFDQDTTDTMGGFHASNGTFDPPPAAAICSDARRNISHHRRTAGGEWPAHPEFDMDPSEVVTPVGF
jgi:hypothetical protein